jgi:hypothetical protein
VPAKHASHRSVSRGGRRDGRYGQKWAVSNGGSRRAEAAVKSSAGSRPLLEQQESPLPRREDDAPMFRSSNGSRMHNGCPANHSSRRIDSTAGRATLHLRHNDHVKKKVHHVVQFRILFLFPFLSLATGTGKGDTPKGILLCEGSGPRALLLIRCLKAGPSEGFRQPPQSTRAPSPPTDQRFEGWPLGRVRKPPQATRAPRPLVIRGSKAGPRRVRQPPQNTQSEG